MLPEIRHEHENACRALALLESRYGGHGSDAFWTEARAHNDGANGLPRQSSVGFGNEERHADSRNSPAREHASGAGAGVSDTDDEHAGDQVLLPIDGSVPSVVYSSTGHSNDRQSPTRPTPDNWSQQLQQQVGHLAEPATDTLTALAPFDSDPADRPVSAQSSASQRWVTPSVRHASAEDIQQFVDEADDGELDVLLPVNIERIGQQSLSDNHLTTTLVKAYEALAWKVHHGLSEKAFDTRPDRPPPSGGIPQSAKAVRRSLLKHTGMRVVRFACCEDVHEAATSEDSSQRTCSTCGKSFYETIIMQPGRPSVQRPLKTFFYYPLSQRLLYEWATPEIAKARREYVDHALELRGPGDDALRDFWDSDVFRDIRAEGQWDRDTMVLCLSTDGVTMTRQKSVNTEVWPVVATNYNDPPELRLRRVYTIALIPGYPHGSLDSFLKPLLDEIKSPIRCYDAHEKRYFNLKVKIAVISGDTPAVAKLMGMKNTNSYMSCRSCTIKGFYDGHVYFPIQEMRMRQDLKHQVIHAAAIGRDGLDRIGYTCLSPLMKLDTIRAPDSFGLDMMHLLSNNIRHFFKLLMERDCFSVDLFGTLMQNSAITIPASVARTPRHVGRSFKSFKAVELFSLALQFTPLLFSQGLDTAVLKAWAHFITATRLVLKTAVTPAEIDAIQTHYQQYVVQFEVIFARQPAPQTSGLDEFGRYRVGVRACISQVHALLHVAHNIQQLGPTYGYWQFWLERYIGKIEATSQKHVVTSIANAIETKEALRVARLMYGKEPGDSGAAASEADPTRYVGRLVLARHGLSVVPCGRLQQPLKDGLSSLAQSGPVQRLLRDVERDLGIAPAHATDWQEWKKTTLFVASGTAQYFDVDASFHAKTSVTARTRSRECVEVRVSTTHPLTGAPLATRRGRDTTETADYDNAFYRVRLILSIPSERVPRLSSASGEHCVVLVATRFHLSSTTQVPDFMRDAGFEGVQNSARKARFEALFAQSVVAPIGLIPATVASAARRGAAVNPLNGVALPRSWIARPFRIESAIGANDTSSTDADEISGIEA